MDVPLAQHDRRCFVLGSQFFGHPGAHLHHDVDVLAGDPSLLPRREHGGVVVDDGHGVVDLGLQSPIRLSGHARGFRGDRPQLHVGRHPAHPVAPSLAQRRPAELGQRARRCDLARVQRDECGIERGECGPVR
ncbi:MAG: hypothetical protein PGN24_07020 [Microbacterium arborescens]